jgi:hypothetical protein
VVTQLPFVIEQKNLRRAPRVEDRGESSVGIRQDRKGVSVLARMGDDLFAGLDSAAVDTDEEDPLPAVLGSHGSK